MKSSKAGNYTAKSKKLRSEITLTKEQLRAIGCVAVESTYLESLADQLLRDACCLTELEYRLLMPNAQLSAKLDTLRDLSKSRIKPEFLGRHKHLFDDLSAEVRNRNNVIHGQWSIPKLKGKTSDKDGTFKWIRTGEAFAIRKKRREDGHTVFSVKRVMTTARSLARLLLELARFANDTGFWPPPFQRSLKPPPIQIRTRARTPNSAESAPGRTPTRG